MFEVLGVLEEHRVILLREAADGGIALERSPEDISLRGDRKPFDKRRDVRLLRDIEIPRASEVTPQAVGSVLEPVVVQRLRTDDQFGGEDVGSVSTTSEGPEAVAGVVSCNAGFFWFKWYAAPSSRSRR